MASRRDQLQSYQFLVQRVISALVLHETDPVQTPLRRLTGAGFASIMVAVIALAAVGVFGLVSRGGNERWKGGQAIVVEKETGTRYVYLEEAGTTERLLHPVANFASAALLVGSTEVIAVSRNSLVDVPRGVKIGIDGAPDELPDPDRMKGAPWTLCSEPARVSGDRVSRTALAVGARQSSGTRVRGDEGILVRDIDGKKLHLVWRSHKYEMPANENEVLQGLDIFGRNVAQVEVGTAWLSALPAGRDLAPLTVPAADRGSASSVDTQWRVGEILREGTEETGDFYLVLKSSIRPVTRVQARTTLAVGKAQATEVDAADVANFAGRLEKVLPPAPTDPPGDPARVQWADVRTKDSTLCASFSDGSSPPEVSFAAQVEGADLAAETERRNPAGAPYADKIVVQPGYGAIVVAMTSPAADPQRSPVFLVTDLGRLYAFSDPTVQNMLGYGDVRPIPMPASLVARIPPGPELDPQLAKVPVN